MSLIEEKHIIRAPLILLEPIRTLDLEQIRMMGRKTTVSDISAQLHVKRLKVRGKRLIVRDFQGITELIYISGKKAIT